MSRTEVRHVEKCIETLTIVRKLERNKSISFLTVATSRNFELLPPPLQSDTRYLKKQ